MTGMQGNGHFQYALDALGDRRNDPATAATLALAFEQRTANLIALYNMDEPNVQGMVDGADMTAGNWVDVTRQIKERLGLK